MKRRLLFAAIVTLAVVAAWIGIGERPAGATGRWLRELSLEPRFASVQGLRVRYVRAGQGPPLVLLHGLASSIYTWRGVFAELAKQHDVVAIDLPGFGGSDLPNDLSFETYPPVVLSLMDQLAMSTAGFAGNSMGGAVAATIAASRPERVTRLALIDSAGFNLSSRDRPPLLRFVGALPAAVVERVPIRRSLTRIALRQVFFDPRRPSEEEIEEYVAPILRPGAAASLSSLLASPRADSTEFQALVGRIQSPTMILWGREDRWVPVAHADRFAAAIRGSRLVVLAGCGHLPQEERPAEVAALLVRFFASPP